MADRRRTLALGRSAPMLTSASPDRAAAMVPAPIARSELPGHRQQIGKSAALSVVPPAPPRRRRGPRQPFPLPSRARARGAARQFQIRFHFLVQQRGPSRRRRGWRRWPSRPCRRRGSTPMALPRRPSYAVAAEGRPRLRAAVMTASTISVTLARARARGGAPIPDPFSFFSSAARTELTAPRLEALAEPTVPPARLDANGAAAAAELRGGCRRPPAPPRRRDDRVTHFRYPRARARGAARQFQIRFHFLVQQRGPSRRRRGWRRWPSRPCRRRGSTPMALPRRPSYPVAAEGRPRLRAAVMVSGVCSLWIFRLARSRSLSIGGWQPSGTAAPAISNNRKTRRLLKPAAPDQLYLDKSASKRTSTRQQLDCAKTLCAKTLYDCAVKETVELGLV